MKYVNINEIVKVARIKELTTTVNAVSPNEGGETNRKIRNCNDFVKNVKKIRVQDTKLEKVKLIVTARTFKVYSVKVLNFKS